MKIIRLAFTIINTTVMLYTFVCVITMLWNMAVGATKFVLNKTIYRNKI